MIATNEAPRKWLWREFIKVAPVLVTLKGATFAGFDALLAQKKIVQRLVRPPASEGVCKLFVQLIAQRGRHWSVTTVAGSTAPYPGCSALRTWWVCPWR